MKLFCQYILRFYRKTRLFQAFYLYNFSWCSKLPYFLALLGTKIYGHFYIFLISEQEFLQENREEQPVGAEEEAEVEEKPVGLMARRGN